MIKIMIKIIVKIKMRFLRLYTKLGRWEVDHDLKIINIKIDQANRDHSGTFFEKDTIKDKIKEPELNKELKDDFLIPYCI